MAWESQSFLQMLQAAIENGCSDIHLAAGDPPAFRMPNGLLTINMPVLEDADLLNFASQISKDQEFAAKYETVCDVDGSFEIANLGRFRFNIFRHKGRLGIVLRVIALSVPTIEQLGLPKAIADVAGFHRGLVLVTGATGSGKSSTLASMIRHINENRNADVVTIEDPIEFVHENINSKISQREVGKDTESFASALRSALRQDPDVVLVGEMRDIETLDIALKAAETGHLVFSTVHTTDAIKTIGRLVAMYPAAEQHMVRLRLSENLKSTISQRLVEKMDGKGKVVVQEIMISNLSIQECIADSKKTGEMNYYIEKSHELTGSQTFDQHLAELFLGKAISLEIAKSAATNPADFERNLAFGDHQSDVEMPKEEGLILDTAPAEISEGVAEDSEQQSAEAPEEEVEKIDFSDGSEFQVDSSDVSDGGIQFDYGGAVDIAEEESGSAKSTPPIPPIPKKSA